MLFLKLKQLNGILISQTRRLSLGVIGAPTCAGQPRSGVELGPKVFRSAGLVRQLESLGHNVVDFGDFTEFVCEENNDFDNNLNRNYIKNISLVGEMCSKLSGLVRKVVRNNRIPVVLGGDHSIAMASISANASQQTNEELCVLWVDAHADINTIETTRTGNLHGMPVSFLIKETNEIFNNPNKDCLPIKPCINANNFAYIGLRDVESKELNIIKKSKIKYYSTQDIDRLGINEVMARVLDQINPQLKKKIHVSFDIDAIDDTLAPSTGTPVPGGLTLREGLCIGEQIYATNSLCALDLCEVNPQIGNQLDVKKTIDSSINIMLSFFGKPRTQRFTQSDSF